MMTRVGRQEILYRLLWKFRVATVSQIAAAYFSHCKSPKKQASKLVGRLISEGKLNQRRCLVRPYEAPTNPTFKWSAGEQPPNFDRIAYRLEKQSRIPLKQETLIFATAKAAKCHGGIGGNIKRLHQVSHDIACTSVFLQFERNHPDSAEDWMSEDLYSKHLSKGQKVGDALLSNESGPYRLIEVLGRYNAAHIRSLHEYAAANNFPYELW